MYRYRSELKSIIHDVMLSSPALHQGELDQLFINYPQDKYIYQNKDIDGYDDQGIEGETSIQRNIIIPNGVYREIELRRIKIDTYEYEASIREIQNEINNLYIEKKLCYRYNKETDRYLNDKAAFDDAKSTFLKFLQSCSPRDFELLCGAILTTLGYKDVKVTQQVGDGGIDFVAKHDLCVGESPERFIQLVFLGQAKKYKDKVGISDIRDFLGATEMLRCGAYDTAPASLTAGRVNLDSIMPFGPHGRLMVSSGAFTNDAAQFAESIGVRCIDGSQIASIFHYYEIGFFRTRVQVTFDSQTFTQEIRRIYSNFFP
jgi:restriction endonuclease Mrr